MRSFTDRTSRQPARRRVLTISLGVAIGLVALGGVGYAITTSAIAVPTPATERGAATSAPLFTGPVTTVQPTPVAAATATVEAAPTTKVQAAPVTTKERAAPRVTARGGPPVAYTCDLNGPPKFGDPAHPNYITNKACGYVDSQGRQRSHDPWIDGQLNP